MTAIATTVLQETGPGDWIACEITNVLSAKVPIEYFSVIHFLTSFKGDNRNRMKNCRCKQDFTV